MNYCTLLLLLITQTGNEKHISCQAMVKAQSLQLLVAECESDAVLV